MKNVSFKKVCGLSLAALFLGCSLQATWTDTVLNLIRSKPAPAPVVVKVVPAGKMQWLKNGLHKAGQTRVAQIAATKAMQGVQLVKDHKVLASITAAALVGAAVVYMLTKESTPSKKRASH